MPNTPGTLAPWLPSFRPWRHGGWYVDNVAYPSGEVGCVSQNYDDGQWRIVCDPRPFDDRPTFPSREDAARAECSLSILLNYEAQGYTLPEGWDAARIYTTQQLWDIHPIFVPLGNAPGVTAWGVPLVNGSHLKHP